MAVLIEQASSNGTGFVDHWDNGAIIFHRSEGQSFTPTEEIPSVTSVSLYLSGSDYSSGATFSVRLRSGSVEGTILRSKDFVIGDIAASPTFGWVEFVFSTPIALSNGVTYYITVEATNTTGPPIGDIVEVGLSDANPYSGGTRYNKGTLEADPWAQRSSEDLMFRVSGAGYTFQPPVPSGLNAMLTVRRLVVAAANKVYYEV
jgi:hypothetical protein